MLVNASRFTAVQGLLRNRLHQYLDILLDSLRVNGARGEAAINDPQIAEIYATWHREFADANADWSSVLATMLEAVASTKVVEVNSRANGLDYSETSAIGQTVIAVGGFSLSRGLTLEGLTTTWFLRNTMMYDTLMQMGRWFGYRNGFEDLCRIWMPAEAIDWYAHIAAASEELHLELKKMEKAKATPSDFGLAVRSHPASLLVTARNKMGSGQKHVLIGLSNAWVETAKITARPKELGDNAAAAERLLQAMAEAGKTQSNAEKVTGGHLLRDISVELIDDFLLRWRNHDQAFLTQPGPVRAYIADRKLDELEKWDVLVTNVNSEAPDFKIGGWTIGPQMRRIGYGDLSDHLLSMSGKRARIASRGVERIGLDEATAISAEQDYLAQQKMSDVDPTKRPSFPDRIYRQVRDKPLFVLHVVQVRSPEEKDRLRLVDDSVLSRLPERPVIGWSISLPPSNKPSDRVEYIINTVKFRELYGSEEQDDDAFEDD
jgi:hypothetical protein